MVLLLCSCSSSDDTENSKGGQSENTMSLSVSTSSDAETRVTETANSTTGLITTWETTDKLNAFHLYKGDTQVTSKTFINSNSVLVLKSYNEFLEEIKFEEKEYLM